MVRPPCEELVIRYGSQQTLRRLLGLWDDRLYRDAFCLDEGTGTLPVMDYLRGDDVDYVFVDLIALSLAPLTSSTLLSPAEMERALSKETPFFGTFRSKEVWLDPFEFILRYPERFAVSDAAAAKIRSEMMRVGEPGPSPRLRERTASKDVASFKRCFDALDTLVADKASDGVPTTASGHMWPQLDVTSSLG